MSQAGYAMLEKCQWSMALRIVSAYRMISSDIGGSSDSGTTISWLVAKERKYIYDHSKSGVKMEVVKKEAEKISN